MIMINNYEEIMRVLSTDYNEGYRAGYDRGMEDAFEAIIAETGQITPNIDSAAALCDMSGLKLAICKKHAKTINPEVI